MSHITVEVGTATIDLRPDQGMFSGGFGKYRPTDVVHAAIKVLRAVGTEDADDLAARLAVAIGLPVEAVEPG